MSTSQPKLFTLLGFGLILITLGFIYCDFPIMRYVLWDDDLLITDNAILKMPLREALRSAFSGFYNGDYIPVTLMSYWLDITLFGFAAPFQHAENILIHMANICLLYVWLGRQVKSRYLLWFTVIMFAIHPLQVETVAWISERKGLLASFFYLLGLSMADRASSASKFRLGFAFGYVLSFVLAAMAKANGLLLPFWLVVSLLVRRQRLGVLAWCAHGGALIAAAVMAYVRVEAYASAIPQFQAVMMAPGRLISWPAMVLASLGFYVRMLFVPRGLSIIYPSFTSWVDWLPEIVAGGIFVLVVVWCAIRWRSRELLIWWFFVLLTLAPVMNLVPRINFVNDRYIYLPIIGFSLVGGTIIEVSWSRLKSKGANLPRAVKYWLRIMGAISLLLGLVWVTMLSRERALVWRDNVALWSDTVAKVPTSSLALNNLGQAYQEQGQIELAIGSFERSLKIADRQLANLAINNLAAIYSSKQYPQHFDLERAKSLLEHGIATVVRPDDSLVMRYNLALVYLQSGDLSNGKSALNDLRLALESTSNQRYRFLADRVKDLQKKIEAQP